MRRSKADLETEIRHLRQQIASTTIGARGAPSIDPRLRMVVDHAPLLFWTANRDLQIMEAAGRLYSDGMVGSPFPEFLAGSTDGADPLAAAANALVGNTSHFSGKLLNTEVAGFISPVYGADSTIVGVTGIALDQTPRRAAEQQAVWASERCKALFNSSDEVMFAHDLDGILVSVDGAAQRLFGYAPAEFGGRAFADLMTAESRAGLAQRVEAMLGGHTPQAWQAIGLTKDDRRFAIEIRARLLIQDGRPAGVEGFIRDVSERLALEEQVRQSQKLDAIGVLAGGIAHDFNNLLTGILGYAYLLQSEPGLNAGALEAVEIIIKSGQRAAQLTSQLLGFARRGIRQEVAVDVHETAREVAELLEHTIDKRIRLACSLQASRHHVTGDPTQIYQLLLNLCLNARDAMPSGGDLLITSRTSGDSVVLGVSDSGSGIPPAIRDRIFEPFFTTKPANKGTGMGLAMVYGIAKNHGGTIHLETEVGAGSSFYVTLPVCAGCQPTGAASPPPELGSGRILVIDDEEVVRRVLSQMLKGLGYQVVTAGDTSQALEYYREQYRQIDLVILDMIMPKMSGHECFFALKAINPAVRAVLSSGYTRNEGEELLRTQDVSFLQKPYRLEQLASAVRSALSRKVAV